MSASLRRLVLPGVLTAFGLTVLVGLGVWQLQRKTWKEALIARIDAVAAAPAAPIADVLAAAARGEDVEFRRVKLAGTFRHRDEFHVWAPRKEGPAWSIVTPVLLAGDGAATPRLVLVIRGIVPEALRGAERRAAGQVDGLVAITGRVRFGAPGPFTPKPNLERNTWMARDLEAMRRIVGERFAAVPGGTAPGYPAAAAAPFFVEKEGDPPPGGWPRPELEPLNLRNEHLGYALTWFGIALTLVAVFAAFARRELRRDIGST